MTEFTPEKLLSDLKICKEASQRALSDLSGKYISIDTAKQKLMQVIGKLNWDIEMIDVELKKLRAEYGLALRVKRKK